MCTREPQNGPGGVGWLLETARDGAGENERSSALALSPALENPFLHLFKKWFLACTYTILYNVRVTEMSFTNKWVCTLMNYLTFSYVEMFRRS